MIREVDVVWLFFVCISLLGLLKSLSGINVILSVINRLFKYIIVILDQVVNNYALIFVIAQIMTK